MSNLAPSVDPYDPGGVMKAFKRALGYDKKTFPRVDSSRTKERRRLILFRTYPAAIPGESVCAFDSARFCSSVPNRSQFILTRIPSDIPILVGNMVPARAPADPRPLGSQSS